jgi:polar amino acid transport system permease protein
MHAFDLMTVLRNPEFRVMIALGAEMTLIVAACSWLLAMALALALLTIRLTPSRIAQRGVAIYVAYHRNVPTLVQLMLWYFGISNLLPDALQEFLSDHDGEAIFAIIALGLCQAAFFSEDLRSGLRSIPPGQSEAARALGHSYVGAMRYVNHTVSLFKNSSLAMAIGVTELTHMIREVESRSFLTFEVYTIATVLYLGTSLVLMGAGAMLARHFRVAAAR